MLSETSIQQNEIPIVCLRQYGEYITMKLTRETHTILNFKNYFVSYMLRLRR